jgi:hypothetical protein
MPKSSGSTDSASSRRLRAARGSIVRGAWYSCTYSQRSSPGEIDRERVLQHVGVIDPITTDPRLCGPIAQLSQFFRSRLANIAPGLARCGASRRCASLVLVLEATGLDIKL